MVTRDLNRAVECWNRFFFTQESSLSLAVFRVVFGSYFLVYWGSIFWLVDLNLGANGVLSPPHLSDHLYSYEISVFPLIGTGAGTLRSLWLLGFLAGLGLTLGAFTRSSAFLVWLLLVSVWNTLPGGDNGGDHAVIIASYLFMIAAFVGHAQRLLSVDRLVRKKRGLPVLPDEIPLWTLRLFQIQLVLIYFFAGWHKQAFPEWYKGYALHYVFQQEAWSRFDARFLAASPFFVALVTYGTTFFEMVIFPVFVWFQGVRYWVLAMGVLFHLGIDIVVKIQVFGTIMPLLYLSFVSPSLWCSLALRTRPYLPLLPRVDIPASD